MLAFLYLKFETFAHVHIAIARYFILLPNYMTRSQREKCPNAEFFWSVFSSFQTEYRDLLSLRFLNR